MDCIIEQEEKNVSSLVATPSMEKQNNYPSLLLPTSCFSFNSMKIFRLLPTYFNIKHHAFSSFVEVERKENLKKINCLGINAKVLF